MAKTLNARSRIAPLLAVVALAVSTLTACGDDSKAPVSDAAAALGTLEPGVLKVAIQPYAPYTSLVGDKMSGLDADILNAVADKLGLKVKPELTDFAGMLASVQSRRVDITIGGVAWTAERQKQGLFTDPPYYSPPAMAVRAGEHYQTVKDLEGKNLGTVEGYVWVKSIQAVPGAKLHAYPDGNGVFDDLGAGRINVGFLDPLLVLAAQKERPELKVETQYLTPPTAADVAAHPAYQYFQQYMTAFYLPKQATALEKAISEQIRAMYANGELTKLIQKYGGDPNQFLKPAPEIAKTRQNVDRPADWQPPSI
ncbi:amino acid ABC transporter substrate-binding protein (PAAT family) [Kribbella rubisoli]|jgi:polar amino acid transport system substrate-binding protein|uniref:Amino acid ABC transporter substrate-binding protein (PAAT family) n=1 Tax=Kribbella rubisoli TaxID=3075929 RepID=A0A4Q7WY25_9ACTN|nr:transporter substrate-binding domain-containing protein [Kribbella rubisoli]RZU15491.1 amino acid ABC transporter substrate-binding protein (PAAT family) [Kribbella rubisoli]